MAQEPELTSEMKLELQARGAAMTALIKERLHLRVNNPSQHWIGVPLPDDDMSPKNAKYKCGVTFRFTDTTLDIMLTWKSRAVGKKITIEQFGSEGTPLGFVESCRCSAIRDSPDAVPFESFITDDGKSDWKMAMSVSGIASQPAPVSVYRLIIEFNDGDKCGMLFTNPYISYLLGKIYRMANKHLMAATAMAAAPAPPVAVDTILAKINWFTGANFNGYRVNCTMDVHYANQALTEASRINDSKQIRLRDHLDKIHHPVMCALLDGKIIAMFELPRAVKSTTIEEMEITIYGIRHAFSYS